MYTDDVFYCLSDGTFLVNTAADVPTIIIPAPVITSRDSPVGKRSTSVLLIAIGLAVVAGGAAIWLISSGSGSKIVVSEPASNQGAKSADGSSDDLATQRESLRLERERLEVEKQRLQLNKSLSQPTSIPSAPNTAPTKSVSPSAGTWFVILGTYARHETEKANQRLSYVQGRGIDASIISTDQYPGLKSGLIAVVVGPFSKSGAKGSLASMKSAVPDAYVKSGW